MRMGLQTGSNHQNTLNGYVLLLMGRVWNCWIWPWSWWCDCWWRWRGFLVNMLRWYCYWDCWCCWDYWWLLLNKMIGLLLLTLWICRLKASWFLFKKKNSLFFRCFFPYIFWIFLYSFLIFFFFRTKIKLKEDGRRWICKRWILSFDFKFDVGRKKIKVYGGDLGIKLRIWNKLGLMKFKPYLRQTHSNKDLRVESHILSK